MQKFFPAVTHEYAGNSFEETISLPAIPGLAYVSEYITPQEEADLIRTIDAQPWITELKRRVQHYGYRYDYKARSVTPESYLGPLPEWLSSYADRLRADGFIPEPPDQVIVNEYRPGQGIAPHIDCVPCFTDTIVSLSLGSPCVMEFTNVETQGKSPCCWSRAAWSFSLAMPATAGNMPSLTARLTAIMAMSSRAGGDCR